MSAIQEVRDCIAEYKELTGIDPESIQCGHRAFDRLDWEVRRLAGEKACQKAQIWPWGDRAIYVDGISCIRNPPNVWTNQGFIASGFYNTPVHGRENQPSEENPMKQPFEVLIIKRATEKEKEAGKDDVIVLGPKVFLAETKDTAQIAAARELPKSVESKDLEVISRPFR